MAMVNVLCVEDKLEELKASQDDKVRICSQCACQGSYVLFPVR